MGKKDAAAALLLAKAQPEDMRSSALLEAAAFQPAAAARTLIRGIFSAEANRTIKDIAKVNTFDPELAQ